MMFRPLPVLHAMAAMLALAAAAPASADDPRLQQRLYDPTEVVIIRGQVNVQATIQFGEGETIENVAIGDSTAWQVTPNKRADLLFVKPLKPRGVTNMTVVTNRHTYFFDLVAGEARPIYVMRFVYPIELMPDEEELAEAAPAPARANPVELAAASDPYAVTDPNAVNFAWQRSGDSALMPERIYDDGDAVFLSWDRDRAVPAILVENRKGVEGPVNYAVRGETLVVDGVPAKLILRNGQQEAELVYAGPGPEVTRERAAQFAATEEME